MCFLIKNVLDDAISFYLYDIYSASNRNFVTLHIKIVKNSKFDSEFFFEILIFFLIFQTPAFCLNCKILGFSGFQLIGYNVNIS